MKEEKILSLPNRLQFFPVMMFAIVMGLSGLTIVLERAHSVFGLSHIFSELLTYITILVFTFISITYILKIFKHTKEVKGELSHPIRINFFAAISISFVLVSILFRTINMDIAYYLFVFGAILHLFLTFYTLSFWINKSVDILHSNPAWFIPIVGNLVVPVGGVGFFDNSFLMYYFSVGIFFWVVMLSIILNRIIFHKQFAPKFMPTLFILIAPPSIGLLAYFKMFETIDIFAQVLYNLGIFFTVLVFFMYKNFLKIEFFISWWAFTFPLATISLASILMYEQLGKSLYLYFSYFLTILLILVVLVVTFHTIRYMFKKEICIME